MLGPSPDWIVGVSGLELCQKNCTWMESKELFLYPWDAGVDSGISYESPDQPTEPQQNITRYVKSCLLVASKTTNLTFIKRLKQYIQKFFFNLRKRFFQVRLLESFSILR